MAEINPSISQSPNLTIAAMQEVAANEKMELNAEQIDSKKTLLEDQESAVNPFASKIQTTQKSLQDQRVRVKKPSEADRSARLLPVEQIKDMAGRFQQRNPELRENVLVLLRENIRPGDTADDIVRKIKEFYPDPSLADEALDFLLATTDGELHQVVAQAKAQFTEQFSREITAGKNITAQAQEASTKGLGTPTTLRGMYQDITGNPRDSTVLFEELSSKYSYKDLKKVVDFLLHSLGADMKSKGPSIERGELHRLFTETRSLQAQLGVFRFFKSRMNLLEKLFNASGAELPQQVSFESMSKEFMLLAAERYPSAGKALEATAHLGVENSISAKIAILSQFRDAVRETALSPIHKTVAHRDELYAAIIEALEDLEDQMDELEDQRQKTNQDFDDFGLNRLETKSGG